MVNMNAAWESSIYLFARYVIAGYTTIPQQFLDNLNSKLGTSEATDFLISLNYAYSYYYYMGMVVQNSTLSNTNQSKLECGANEGLVNKDLFNDDESEPQQKKRKLQYACKQCGKTYVSSDGVKKHWRKCHQNINIRRGYVDDYAIKLSTYDQKMTENDGLS